MRASVKFEVFGKTLEELKDSALEAWHEFTENDKELPHDAEFNIEQYSPDEYKATVHVRLKVDE